jgi:hypothetical protein
LIRRYIWIVALYCSETWTLKIGADVFVELSNMVLEENGDDKMVRENKEGRAYRREENALIISYAEK